MYLEPFHPKKERRRMSTIGLALLAMSLVTIIVYYELAWISRQFLPADALTNDFDNILMVIAQYGFGLLVCLLIMSRVKPDPMEQHALSATDLIRYFCIGAFFLYAGDYLGMMINDSIGILMGHETSNYVSESLMNDSLWLSILTSVFLAPLIEELVFRKFIVDRMNRYGDAVAMWTSGLLFGLYHGNLYQFFYAAWVGCLLAYVYLRTGRIRYTIGLHMAMNALFGVIPVVIYRMSPGAAQETAASVVNACMLGLVGFGLASFFLRYRKMRYLKSWLDATTKEMNRVIWLNVGMILLLIFLLLEFIASLFV